MNEKILLFIPTYNCAKQIPRVIDQLTHQVRTHLAEIIVVDNRSTDESRQNAIEALRRLRGASCKLLLNDRNYGLGGSHKIAFNYALQNGFDYVIVLHGDDQGDLRDLIPLLSGGAHRNADCLLGSRFMRDSRLEGYSLVRTVGNIVFNLIYSLVSLRAIKDLGSGLNVYSVAALRGKGWLKNPDDLTFNYCMLLRSISENWRILYFPLSWRESDQVSNVKLVRQSIRVLGIALSYLFSRRRFSNAEFSTAGGEYTSSVVFESAGT